MNSETGSGGSFDLSAVGAGVLWGLMLMLLGALVQGVMAYRAPLSPSAELGWTYAWQGMGALLAGFLSGRRALGSGWLHGAAAGMGLALAAAGVMGVLTALPGLLAMLKALGLGAGLGALAGIVGVNFGSR
ncbi:MAG: TIGR04086 family membrane protein [Bacillota bacterium]